jgi:isopentenyl-diphosphate Delta-isomerase
MADYHVDIVNEKDEVIGKDLKSHKRAKGFISRVAAVYLCDSRGKYLMCKRAAQKEDAPGLWDLAVCGNVESGESYEEAAKRELEEELEINCELKLLGKYYEEVEATRGGILKVWCGVFFGITDGLPKLNHELEECRKMSISQIEAELKSDPAKFCHGFQIDFKQVKDKLKNINRNL